MDPKTGAVGDYDLHGKPVVTVGMTAPTEKPDPKQNPRFKAMEEIARRREAERKDEMSTEAFDVLNDDGSIVEAAPKPKEIPATQATPPQEPPADGSPPDSADKEDIVASTEPQEPAKEEMRTLIVDGKSIEVPISKIIDAGVRTFQKETAADLRLAAASRLEQQARERFAQPPQDAVQEVAPQAQEDDAALAHAIQFGTEEQAKQAIAKLRNAGQSTDPRAVQGFVQQNILNMVPEVMKFQDANQWVRNEYKEIFADPLLEQQFMLSENARRQSGDSRTHRELYKELADTMVTRFRLRDAPAEALQAPATPQEGADRLVRKASSPRPMQAAGGQKAPTAPQRAPTVTDFVEKQRALRGLAPMPRSDQSI